MRDDPDGDAAPRRYLYTHKVTLEETNAIGNAYFARHLGWQGRCREHFLAEHAPGVAAALGKTVRLVTVRVSCSYYEELFAFEDVTVAMALAELSERRLLLRFDYLVRRGDADILAAAGDHEIGCMILNGGRFEVSALPSELVQALDGFRVK